MQDITQESQQIEEIPRLLEVRLGYVIGKRRRERSSKCEIVNLTASSRFRQPYCATLDQKLRAVARPPF
jgi:hypothetical protein